MPEHVQNFEITDINKLVPYARNARTHSAEQIKKIQSSIREFGFINPILIDKNYNIIAGHGRLLAAKAEGLINVPCVMVEHLTETQKKAYMLADNRLAEDAGWDDEMLKVEIEELEGSGFEIDIIGFSEKEIDELLNTSQDAEEDDFSVDDAMGEIVEPASKTGDIWLLGRHRLMCGDSTVGLDVEKLTGKVKADMMITDPPYNVDYKGGTKDKLTIKNDSMGSEEFRSFLTDAFTNAFANLKNGAAAYVFHSDTEGYNFRGAYCDAGFKLAQSCVWVKNSMVMGRQDYQWQHEPVICGEKPNDDSEWEPIIYGWNPSGKHSWHSNRKQKTVWYFDKPTRSKEHPTTKPVKLVAYPIQNSSKQGDLVLDLFGGSGSTLIACEQINRICYMMELDPKYCDVIIKRWEKLTGQQAALITV